VPSLPFTLHAGLEERRLAFAEMARSFVESVDALRAQIEAVTEGELEVCPRRVARLCASPSPHGDMPSGRSPLICGRAASPSAFSHNAVRYQPPCHYHELASRHCHAGVHISPLTLAMFFCLQERTAKITELYAGGEAVQARLRAIEEADRENTAAGVLTNPHTPYTVQLLAARWAEVKFFVESTLSRLAEQVCPFLALSCSEPASQDISGRSCFHNVAVVLYAPRWRHRSDSPHFYTGKPASF